MKRRLFTQSALAALLATGAVAMTGCGFKLRGSFSYAFKTLLSGFGDTSTLGNEFKRVLASDGAVALVTDPAKAQVVLEVISEQREKVVVGTTSSGQVREFQLRIRLKFKLCTPSGKEITPETELLVQRDISYNESAALAKESEEGLLYRDMQTDMVQQLLRRLSAVKEL
ncbi:MAG: LPS assembly lipoprotein LptE [Burkholderiaceae bacterium]